MAKKTKPKEITLKEYIYLDNIEMNSILAQFEDGIPQLIRSVQQSTTSYTDTHSKTKSFTQEGGIDVGAKAEIKHSSADADTGSELNGELNQQAIDTVYSDYAVDLIEDKLNQANALKTTSKQPEGAFVKLQSSFSLFDFESLYNLTRSNAIYPLMKMADDYQPEWQTNAETMSQSAEVLNSIFSNTVFFKQKNSLAFAESNNLRMNLTQLQMLSNSTRKITMLGKIESIVSEEDISEEPSVVQESEDSESEDSFEQIRTIIPKMATYFLKMFTGIKKDDRLIKPIAIYFE